MVRDGHSTESHPEKSDKDRCPGGMRRADGLFYAPFYPQRRGRGTHMRLKSVHTGPGISTHQVSFSIHPIRTQASREFCERREEPPMFFFGLSSAPHFLKGCCSEILGLMSGSDCSRFAVASTSRMTRKRLPPRILSQSAAE